MNCKIFGVYVLIQYYIALTLIHINNKDINYLIKELKDEDTISILNGNSYEMCY